MPYANSNELKHELSTIFDLTPEGVRIRDVTLFKDGALDRLVDAATNGSDEVKDVARWIIWSAGQSLGCGPASIQGLYDAMERGDVTDITVPVVDLGQKPFEIARGVFCAGINFEAAAILFSADGAKDEGHLNNYAVCVMAAAIKESWNTPFFFCFPSVCESDLDSRFTTRLPNIEMDPGDPSKEIQQSFESFGIRRSYDMVRRHVLPVRVDWPRPTGM